MSTFMEAGLIGTRALEVLSEEKNAVVILTGEQC